MIKQRHNHINNALKLMAVLLSVLIVLGISAPAFALPDESGENYKEPIMVSLGDSYSSGEGIEPFYCADNEDRYSQPDWLAHRSRLSWPGKLYVPDSEGNRLIMSQNKANYSNKTKSYDSYGKNNWYFVASSGAETYSLNGTQNKYFDYYSAEYGSFEHGVKTLDAQLKVFDSIKAGTTDYVTMTMGGNDAHFADVFIYAAMNCSFININGMDDYINGIWDEFYNGANSIKNRLIKAYSDIHCAAGNQAHIIIAGYPKILPKNGFLIFSASESKSINTAITMLNAEMKNIVQSLQSESFKIHFVSVEEAFEGHEIYTGNFKAYLNGIKFAKAQDLSHSQIISASSLHPNNNGAKAYAACVQECINQIELEKLQSANEAGNNAIESGESDLIYDGEVPEPEQPTSVYYNEESTPQTNENEDTSTNICTITADLSEFNYLEGAQVFEGENSLCAFESTSDFISEQSNLVVPVIATDSQAQICFYKQGYTNLSVEIDNICAGKTLELTAALKEAAQERKLMAKGDVNCDGCISILDVSQILSLENYGSLADESELIADLNEDGKITIADIAVIKRSDNYGATDLTITFEPS